MMRHAIAAALVAVAVATPVHATVGLECRPVSGVGPRLSFTIGSGIPGGLVGVSVDDGAGWFSTNDKPPRIAIRNNWIDEQIVWLDLVDARTGTRVLRLRTVFEGKRTHAYAGTLARHGRITRVRCIQG